MSFKKYAIASATVQKIWTPGREKTASKMAEELDVEGDVLDSLVFDENRLYVKSRALSASTNLNLDAFPKHELYGEIDGLPRGNDKYGFSTFKNARVHVDHANNPNGHYVDENERLANVPRGEILYSWMREDPPIEIRRIAGLEDPIMLHADGDIWVEILMANDRKKFPVLCRAIEDGIITKVSMGAEVTGSTCSVCGNLATIPSNFCQHVSSGRGQRFTLSENSPLNKWGVLNPGDPVAAFEINHGLQFFEESWILDVQADPTAIITELVRGEPGLPISGIKAASANRNYDSMLIDILNLESSMGDDAREKVAQILKRSDEESNVTVNIDNLPEEIEEAEQMDYNIPPSQQPGIHFPDYPFPCSAKVSASEANPQYPMDTTIDVEVCQGCMYNKTDKVGGVDCSFPEIARKGGSDPLPPEFAKPEEGSEDAEEGSGFQTEDGHEIRLIPGTEHPPGNRTSAKRNEAFYKFKDSLTVSSGYWKEGAAVQHSVEISIPSNQFTKDPVQDREDIVSDMSSLMEETFGNVESTSSVGTWLDEDEVHNDDKLKLTSLVDDLSFAEDFTRKLSRDLELITNNASIEFHIDGEPFYSDNPEVSGKPRKEDWNPQNEIEILGADSPEIHKQVVDMLTNEFGGTGSQDISDPEASSPNQIISYFDDEDMKKALNVFDLLDEHNIDTTNLEVSVNGNPLVA